jgi:hypothetical protein
MTALDVIDRLAHHGICLSASGSRLSIAGAVTPGVRRRLARHRPVLVAALRGRDSEIALEIPAQTLSEIGAFRLRGVWTHDLGDQVIWDLFLGLVSVEDLAAAHRDKVARAQRMLAGTARRM